MSATSRSILIYAPIMASIGGIERHLCLLAQACTREGMRVTFVTTSNSLNDGARRELLASGVEFLEFSRPRGSASALAKAAWLLRTTLRLRRTRWDVIYTNGQSVLATFLWLAARRGTRIVHHHHTSSDAAEQRTWHPLYRLALRFAPEVVTVSQATRGVLDATLGRDDVRCVLCLTPRIPLPERIEDRRPAADAPLRFGYVGRLVAEKGIGEICRLSALPELRDIEWHLYGAGPDYPAAHFAAFPNVHYHGLYASMEEYAGALQQFDATVLYSRHSEGLPLTLMEAMAAGLPWIATDRGGTRELALSAENCRVLPAEATPAQIAEATREFADRIRAGGTSRAAQRRVYDAQLSPATIEAQWLALFREPARGAA